MKIGIQGELGAYSHIAVENLYKNADIKTCSTFEDTFKLAYNDQKLQNSYSNRKFFSRKSCRYSLSFTKI